MRSEEDFAKQEAAAKLRIHIDSLKPISFTELEAVFNKWLLIVDPYILRFLMGAYGTIRLKGRKPAWCIIIGPSRGGKTEFLNSLYDLGDIYPMSLLTPQSFLSGMPGGRDASLLPLLGNKIMLFKDWTSVLSMQQDARREIMAQLREIWDGSFKKVFGNGQIRDWEGRVGLIAASTQVVDLAQQMHTTLGERFLNYRIIMPDRKEVTRRSLKNNAIQDVMQRELKDAVYAYIQGIDWGKEIPGLNEAQTEELIILSDFACKSRSGVIRDAGNRNEVMFVPSAEIPTGLAQALESIAFSLALQFGKLDEISINMIYKTTLDSIPQTNKMVILEMAKRDEQSTTEIANALGYPNTPIRMYLENLSMLRVCRRMKGKDTEEGGAADRWTMYPEYVEIIRKYEKISPIWSDEEIAMAEKEEEIDAKTLFENA